MKHRLTTLWPITLAVLFVGGCGGSGINVDQLMQDRLDATVSFYTDIGEILENNSGEEAVPKLESLKEEYEQVFGALGRQHAQLTRDERLETVRAWDRIKKENPRYQDIQQLRRREYRRMQGWTQETVNLIDGFSIIPGYADSTNLKATRPEVAKRLGIE